MKATTKIIAVFCLALVACTLVGCNLFTKGSFTALGTPEDPPSLAYSDIKKEDFMAFKAKLEDFNATFSSVAYLESNTNRANVAISPVSVYMALAMAVECTAGQTRAQILDALGMTYDEVEKYTSLLFRQLDVDNVRQNKTVGRLDLYNSIWIDDGLAYNQNAVENLAGKYFCYSNSTDFDGDNVGANKAVRNFIKEKTNKLIDKDFELGEETIFALINTLYLKDVWNDIGKNLNFASGTYTFQNSNGSTKDVSLLQPSYLTINVIEGENYRTAYTMTESRYKIKFILPKGNCSVNQIFTAETLREVAGITDYKGIDEENRIEYHTRVLFPEFKASYDGEISGILQNTFGVTDAFSAEKADFSPFIADSGQVAYLGKVQHVTELNVDKKGIEGAAVTLMQGAGSAAPPPYTKVYQDFIIDRAFGFIITDYYDTTIFSGVVNGVN